MPFAPELLDELLKDNKTPEDPQTQVQLCMVHLLRSSLQYVSYKDRKEVASGLKTIYTAATELEAETALTDFEKKHSSRYAMIGKSWWANWMRIIPMYSYPAEIRRAIYTTNTIESLNMTLRKVIKTRASFPSDETALSGIAKHQQKRGMPIRNWSAAMNQFSVIFESRVPMNGLNSFTQSI